MFLKKFGNRSSIGKRSDARIFCSILLCLYYSSLPAAAWGSIPTQGNTIGRLSLETLTRSISEYPSVQAAEAAMRASRAALEETESLAGWSFDAGFGVGEHTPLVVSSVTPSYIGSQFSAELRYPILGSQAVQEENEAKARTDVATQQAQIEESRLAAILALRRYYIAYWLAWNSARVAKTWRLWLEAKQGSVHAEREQGFWSTIQVLQFRSDLEQARASEITFTQQAKAALAGINGLAGVEPRYLVPAIPALSVPSKSNDLVNNAIVSDPRIISLKAQLQQLSADKKNSWMQHLGGNIFIGGGNVYEPSRGRNGYQVNLGVEISGPVDFVQADRAYHTKINASIEQVQIDIREELLARQAAVERAVASLAASEESLHSVEAMRQAAESAWRGMESQFTHGRGNILSDYIASRGQLFDAEKEYFVAQANYWESIAKLDYLVGNAP